MVVTLQVDDIMGLNIAREENDFVVFVVYAQTQTRTTQNCGRLHCLKIA
jgi:hypothetical protein